MVSSFDLQPTLFAGLTFRGSFPVWAAILCAVMATAVIFFAYFREGMKLERWRRILLASLRSITVAFVLLLLCKPVWEYPRTEDRPRRILVILDTSESMQQRDPRTSIWDQIRLAGAKDKLPLKPELVAIRDADKDPGEKQQAIENLYNAAGISLGNVLGGEAASRLEVLRAALTNKSLDVLGKLKAKGPLTIQTFDSTGDPILLADPKPDGEWPGLNITQPKTALFGAIYQALQVPDDQLPAAIFLATDGLNNVVTYEDPEKRRPIDLITLVNQCKKLRVPLHIYGVGGSPSRLLNLKELDVNSILFAEDRARVRVAWRNRGVKTGMVQVDVTLNGKVVASEKFPAREGEHIEETLSFVPDKADVEASLKQGKLTLAATVKFVDAPDSDTFTKAVRVVESKVKLLFVENTPRWEFKFLQRALLRDRRVEPLFLILKGDPETMKSGKPYLPAFPSTREQLFQFDLLILGDVDINFLTPEQRTWVKEFVEDGSGLIVLAGRQHAPASFFGTPIGDLLPVEFDKITFPIEDKKRPVEYKPALSDVGVRSAMMSLEDTPEANDRTWKSLPGWYWYYPTTRLKPAAISLLEHPKDTNDDKRPMPLIAMHYFGRGLVLFCASDETWRWRWNEENEADKYFSRFWGQVIYQVGLPRALGGRSRIGIVGGDAILGKAGKAFAQLYTKDFLPLKTSRVAGVLEWTDAPVNTPLDQRVRKVFFDAVPNHPGEYVVTLPNDQQGKFNIRVTDLEAGGDATALDYRVSPAPGGETSPGTLDEETLADLARQTNGAFYREEDLPSVADKVKGGTITVRTPNKNLLLWEQWWVLVTVVSLLTTEWLVRKFSNLS